MTTPDESVRDMEQVRHSIETKELPSSQLQAESQTSSVRIVTPIYKLQEKQPGSEVHMGGNHEHSQRLSAVNGDYKAERSQEEFRMKIIDPKVNSNAHIPSQTGSLPNYGRRLIDDFPSQHGKRSLLKLDPLEQRRIRSVESRPITTSAYLTESVNRHRDMEESKLRKYLKASEDDANKPWNKPDWPGPKNDDGVGESLRELEQIRKKIDLLQMAALEPKKNNELDELARKNKELADRSKNRRTDYKLVGSDIIKTDPEPLPSHFKDDKPRSIMKRSQLESREQMTYAEPERRIVREAHSEVVRAKPKVTETVETVEDHKRTEEIERRIIRRERRHRSSRHRYGHGQHEYVDWNNGGEERQQRLLAEEQQRRSLIEHQQRQRSLHEAQQRSLAKGLQQQRLEKRISEVASGAENRSVMHHKVEKKESYERSSRRMASQGSQTVANREKQTALRRYDGRRYTSEELNQAVKRAYQAVDKAHSDIRQWRSNSMQRSGGGQQNGYLPAYESYHRSTSTRRDRERDHGDYSRAFDNSGLAHARYGSLSDSLRRGELRYVPNGDFRENYGRSNKMHKSYSSRDVFNDGTRDSSWHRGSVGQGGQGQQAQGPAPVVEFPPTLPRQGEQPPVPPPHRGFSDNNSIYRPIVKSRSYADWDEPRFWKPQNPL